MALKVVRTFSGWLLATEGVLAVLFGIPYCLLIVFESSKSWNEFIVFSGVVLVFLVGFCFVSIRAMRFVMEQEQVCRPSSWVILSAAFVVNVMFVFVWMLAAAEEPGVMMFCTPPAIAAAGCLFTMAYA